MDNIKYLIEGDGFRELTYLSIGVNSDKVNVKVLHTPWDARAGWERLVKARDGADSGAKVDVFSVMNKSASKMDNGGGTIRDYQYCNEQEKKNESHEIKIRVGRGKGANYVHSGWCRSNGDRDNVRDVFKELDWNDMKEQGLTLIDFAMERWQQILHERVSYGISEQGLAALS